MTELSYANMTISVLIVLFAVLAIVFHGNDKVFFTSLGLGSLMWFLRLSVVTYIEGGNPASPLVLFWLGFGVLFTLVGGFKFLKAAGGLDSSQEEESRARALI